MKTQTIKVERVQTGVRLEKKILKVLKGLADYKDRSLGEVIEGIVMHAFENKPPFCGKTLEAVQSLKKIHALDYDVHDYEDFMEESNCKKLNED